jgi:hypothetical protein
MRTDGQIDRHDEANSRFLQFCKRTLKQVCLRLQVERRKKDHNVLESFKELTLSGEYICRKMYIKHHVHFWGTNYPFVFALVEPFVTT